MACMCTIFHIEKDFEDNAWQNYDTAFWRQAACAKSLEWGMIDPTLYSIVNTDREVWFLLQYGPPLSWLSNPNTTTPMAMDVFSTPTITGSVGLQEERAIGQKRRQTEHNEICYLFNAKGGNKCIYRACKFSHACLLCRGNHPRSKVQE